MKFATIDQVAELADAVGPRYRALVLLAAFGGLRWGELGGLRRRRVDLLHRTVAVAEILTEVNGRLDIGPPKTEAGRRTVVLSAFLVDELATHLEQRGEPGPDGLVFPAPEGGPMRRSNFRRRTWEPATRAVGVPGLRFHDLRHSAGTLSAVAGATTKELMARMGHSSPRAALIYQHATAERDGAIADALDRLVAGTLAASSRPEPPLPLRPADASGS
jgi:integrase